MYQLETLESNIPQAPFMFLTRTKFPFTPDLFSRSIANGVGSEEKGVSGVGSGNAGSAG